MKYVILEERGVRIISFVNRAIFVTTVLTSHHKMAESTKRYALYAAILPKGFWN